MRQLLLIFIFISFYGALNVFAQTGDSVDELLEKAKSAKNDSVKAAVLNRLGFMGNDYGLNAEKYAKEALLLSAQLNIKSEIADAYLLQSTTLSEIGKYDSALILIQKAQEIFPKNDSSKHAALYAKYYFALAMLSQPQGNEKDGTLKDFTQALKFAKFTKDNYLIAVCYSGVSSAYNSLRLFDKSIESDKEYLDFALQSNDKLILAKAYNNLSASYLNAGNNDQYEHFFREYEKLVPELKNPYYNWLMVHNRAMGRAEKGNINQAITDAILSISVAKENNLVPSKLLASYYLTGYCYFLNKQHEISNRYMEEVFSLADSIHSSEYKMYAVSGLAENFYALGEYKKAAENLSRQIELSDSISSAKIKINSNYLHIKNRIELKDSQLMQQSETIKRSKIVNFILLCGIASFFTIVFLGYRNYNQHKKLQQQKINELETEKRLLATQSVLKGVEEERSRIAKDLHDGLGGLLSGVKLQLGAMKGNLILTEENGIAFNRVLHSLEDSIAEMRRVAHNMMPETLLKFGLEQALTDYSNSLSHQQHFTIQCTFRGMEKRLDNSTEVVIYRIVQELINNAVKHSGADSILVQLMRHDEAHINITVEDNGKGYQPDEVKEKSAGLKNIASRVKYLNGKMDIQSELSKGTSVFIECELKS